jgi:hypothetical protein
MRFESVFRTQFHKAADRALSVARRGAFVEGCTYGFACGLIYLAEALLFYFGAVLVARGTYSYLKMVQVLNLVVFTVTIGSQLMAFSTISAAWAGWAQGEEYGSSAPPNLQVTLPAALRCRFFLLAWCWRLNPRVRLKEHHERSKLRVELTFQQQSFLDLCLISDRCGPLYISHFFHIVDAPRIPLSP